MAGTTSQRLRLKPHSVARADKATTTRRTSTVRWAVKYGIWAALGCLALVWELLSVNTFRRWAGDTSDRSHPTISDMVWLFEAHFGLAGRGVVAASLLDLMAHFLFRTPLVPGIG